MYVEKAFVYLLIVGAMLGAGIVLSFYGAQLSTQDLFVEEFSLSAGASYEIDGDLDPEVNEMGVFVVQRFNPEESNVNAKIIDPLGFEIIFESVEEQVYESNFELSEAGIYKLIIENTGSEDLQMVGVIGHMPSTASISVGLSGFFLLIIGLIGIVGVGIYAIRNRKKERFS